MQRSRPLQQQVPAALAALASSHSALLSLLLEVPLSLKVAQQQMQSPALLRMHSRPPCRHQHSSSYSS